MNTIILPGYSPKNKEWAYETKSKLAEANISTEVIEWSHWTDNAQSASWKEWVEIQTHKVSTLTGSDPICILAKSAGTAVAINLLSSKSVSIQKLVLCGIPLNDLTDEDTPAYKVLQSFPLDNLLCIQNENDSHGIHAQVISFLSHINPAITVVSKPGDTHEYPYYEDFINFFTKED